MEPVGNRGLDVLNAFILFEGAEALAWRALGRPVEWGLPFMGAILAIFLAIHLNPLRLAGRSPGRAGRLDRLTAAARLRRPRISPVLACIGLAGFIAFRLGLFFFFLWRANSGPPAVAERVAATLWPPESPDRRLLHLGFAVVAAPLIEEICFRGWIQGALQRWYGPRRAVVGAALLFGVAHGAGALTAFLMGSIFGVAVLVTRSAWTGVILHAIANAASMLPRIAGPAAVLEMTRPSVVQQIWVPALLMGLGVFASVVFRASAKRR